MESENKNSGDKITENSFKITDYLPDGSPLGFGKYEVSTASCINVLLMGRTQVGKSAIVRTLLNPQKGTYSEGLSDTKDPQMSSLILEDKATKLLYQINIIDTPGLAETREDNQNRSDDQLMNMAIECVRQNITWLNVVCLVTPAGKTHLNDVNAFKLLIKSLGERYSQIAMMVLTHCDEFSDQDINKFIGTIETHECTRPFYEYCGLGVYRFGAIDCKHMENYPEPIRVSMVKFKLEKIEEFRSELIEKIISCVDIKLKIEELQFIFDKIQSEQDAKIKQALQTQKVCSIQ